MRVPFNKAYLTGREVSYVTEALGGRLAGDGPFTQRCHAWITERIGCHKSLLTHSCTAALEMAALLSGVGPGDEIIMPSYTFVSTANAFVLRGATPVFVDIRPDTLNLDETLIEAAISPRTRAIVPVHYAGVGCEMDAIMAIAGRHGLLVIEDDAQGLMATYRGRPLGSIGHLAALSFHETKNIVAGEGGALLINDPRYAERAEIIREKGTNRSAFFRGQVDKYTWVDIGSSFLPGELTAAVLLAQCEEAEAITRRRRAIWHAYDEAFAALDARGVVRRPVIPPHCDHNAHLYYLLFADLAARTRFIAGMREAGVDTAFHYVPLHESPVGRRVGRAHGDLRHTCEISERLVRLPLWPGLESRLPTVIERAIRLLAD